MAERRANDRLVTDVNPVKHTDGQMDRPRHPGKFWDGTEDNHGSDAAQAGNFGQTEHGRM